MSHYDTHEVFNQPPVLEDTNLFTHDRPLREAMEREGAAWALEKAESFGAVMGSAEVIDHARLANRYTPIHHSHDRRGFRVDRIELHPSWHAMMKIGIEAGMQSIPWKRASAGHVGRAALYYLFNQGENGSACPITMTFAALPALRNQPDQKTLWKDKLLSDSYDPRFIPASEKTGVLMGMAMTEKQGGSDVRENTTRAVRQSDNSYELTGHKWFCSSPQADAFLTLAYTDEGLSCFLVPRFRPDGSQNRFFIQRLKDKLGNKSNPSSEIEYDHTWATRIGELGRGVPTIINMVHHTRLDCVLGSAGMMRLAITHALHHAKYRKAFGKRLIEQPLMKNVLADLCLELEGVVALMMRLARSFDGMNESAGEAALSRVMAPIAKYWVCKRNTPVVYEALECLGGNGYVEESPLARLYRDAPLNGIWEGSGNVICLDVLRAMQRTPEARETLLRELVAGKGQNSTYDSYLTSLLGDLEDPQNLETRSRMLVERLALALQANLLVQHAPEAIAEAFCSARLSAGNGLNFGTLPSSTPFDAILARATEL